MSMLRLRNPHIGQQRNACFVNSTVQVLSSVPQIHHHFVSKAYKIQDAAYPISDEISRIFDFQGHSTETQILRQAVGISCGKKKFYVYPSAKHTR